MRRDWKPLAVVALLFAGSVLAGCQTSDGSAGASTAAGGT
jgi:hypothetical protein